MMSKQSHIQVRLDITIWVCRLLIWNCQHSLVRISSGNKGAIDFQVLTVKVCKVGEERLKGSNISLFKALTRTVKMLVA